MIFDRRRGQKAERLARHAHQIVVHARARLVHDRAGLAPREAPRRRPGLWVRQCPERARRAPTTRRARLATSARRRSTGRRRRVSCADARAAGRRASRTCLVWWSRQRFWSRRPRTTTCLALISLMRGGSGGTRVVCASKVITASCGGRSGGPAGRRTWGGRRRTRPEYWRFPCLATVYGLQITTRTRCLWERPSCLCCGASA